MPIGIFEIITIIRGLGGFLWDFIKLIRFIKSLFHKNDEEEVKHALALKQEFQQNLQYDESGRDCGEAIIINIKDRGSYPDADEDDRAFRISNWFKIELKGLYHNGLEIYGRRQVNLRFDLQTNTWRKIEKIESENDFVAWEIGRIPYKNIKSLDWHGDEFYPFLHIYCTFDGMLGMPYESFKYYYQTEKRGFLYPIENYNPWEKDMKFPRSWYYWIRYLINR